MTSHYISSYKLPSLSWDAVKTSTYHAARQAINSPGATLLTVGRVAFKGIQCYMLYSIFEAALSDILALKTLRHGTNPYAFLRIHLEGPDLDRGGTGGEARWFETSGQGPSPYAQRDQGCFYVVEDFDSSSETTKIANIRNYFFSKYTLKYYSLRSTVAFIGYYLPLPKTWKAAVTKEAVKLIESDFRAHILGLITPSVKFHLNPSSFNYVGSRHSLSSCIDFAYDGDDFPGALVTKYRFSVFDTGFIGILKNGINRGLLKRICDNKAQVLWGFVQLTTAVVMTAFIFPTLLPIGSSVVNMAASIEAIAGSYFGLGTIIPYVAFGAPTLYGMTQF